jgi:hypothetical protein
MYFTQTPTVDRFRKDIAPHFITWCFVSNIYFANFISYLDKNDEFTDRESIAHVFRFFMHGEYLYLWLQMYYQSYVKNLRYQNGGQKP